MAQVATYRVNVAA